MEKTCKSKRGIDVSLPTVDKKGHTIDFYLSATRNTQAAKRFLGKALKSMKPWAHPGAINTDKAPAYRSTITELKAEGKCQPDTVHRQVKYLNNIIEADHGKLKRLINPMQGFKSMKTAYATALSIGSQNYYAGAKGRERPD